MRNNRQIIGELREYTSTSAHISAANRPKVEHLILNKCFDTVLFHNGQICNLLVYLYINEY